MPNDSRYSNPVNGHVSVQAIDTNGHLFSSSSISGLIAKYGSSSATTWLELDRYRIWRPSPSHPILESSFPPIQGFIRKDVYVFAWGNPVTSSPSALEPTARAFIAWVKSEGLRPVWCCVDKELERILGVECAWSTVHCIYEDIVDPEHVIALTGESAKGHEGVAVVKDLKKNIRRAEKENVVVEELRIADMGLEKRREVERGIEEWKLSKSGSLAATAFQPWLDAEHRRYWLARKDDKVIGIIIISPISSSSYSIKNAISFVGAPKGTSEELIYVMLNQLHREDVNSRSTVPPHTLVTFGISASDKLIPGSNLSGWKITWLSKTYGKIAGGAGLMRRGDFRSKFDTSHKPMWVCYPEDGFGLDGVHALLKVLKR